MICEHIQNIVLEWQKYVGMTWMFFLIILISLGMTPNVSALENEENNSKSPMLGVDSNGNRIISKGISYNEHYADVERYFTPFPLIIVNVGDTNKADFKIYDELGPENIRHFSFAFGLDKNQIISQSKTMIELDIDFDGTEIVTITDPENVLERVIVTTNNVSCNDHSEIKCLNVTIYHTFRAPLDFNIVATDVWNTKRYAWQNYYNHGVGIVGDSLNPPKEHDGYHKGQIYHLTETSKTTATDEFDNSWSLEYGQWSMDYIQNKKIVDKTPMNGYDRHHAFFNAYKDGQILLAENKLREICLECFNESYGEINDIFAYEFSKIYESKFEDPSIQNRLVVESQISEQKLDLIFEKMYPAMVFD